MRPVRLLVTGFGPFPGMPANPSGALAKRVAGSRRWRGLGVEAGVLVLPTTYAAITGLTPAIEESRPDAILMIGVAGRSRAIRVEAFGRNRTSTLFPDAARFRPASPLLAAGPASRRTGMRPAAQVATLRRHGLKARVSRDAGRYLCNAAYFTALEKPLPVLFVHIPKPGRALVRRPGAKRRASWQERLAEGLVEVATDLVRRGRTSAVMPGPGPGIHAFLADGR